MNQKEIIDFAWKAHQAQESWTGKADVKGSILLAADGTIFASMLALHYECKNGVALLWLTGLMLLGASAVLAGLSIKPRVTTPPREKSSDLIYFGHLKDSQPGEIAKEMHEMTRSGAIEGLSRQLVAMSRTNWRKHKLLIASTWCAIAAIICICSLALYAFLVQ